MAVDTFTAYVGVYPNVDAAKAGYQLVKDLHTQAGLLDAYDAAVIQRRADGKVKITKQHETPTRVGGALGGHHRRRRGAGAVTGHASAGISRSDLKDLGEYLDTGQAGLVVVGVADMGPRSSRRCATPTRWRPGSSRPTPTRSSATPRPPGEDYAPTPPVRSAPHDRVEARKGCP
jgi:hypothetical protein